MTPQQAILAILIPGVVSATALVALSFLPGRDRPAEDGEGASRDRIFVRPWPAIVAVAAFFFADLGLNQWHDLWPKDATQRFLAVGVAAALIGALHSLAGRVTLTVMLRVVLGAGLALGVLVPLPEMYMPRGLLIVLTGASGLWLGATGAVLDGAGSRLPRAAVPLVLAATAIIAAPGIFKSGYAGGAQLAVGLGALAGGAFVAAVLRRRTLPGLSGLHTVWLAVFATILLVTYGYQEVPAWWALPIMAVAPLGVVAGLFGKHRLLRVVLAGLVSAVIVVGATLAVVASASNNAAPEEESYYGY
ncbi:MAG: hypothetical protein Q9O74_01890 [Planctomycetota bacterium]|nr:hypothetical protein [Planctomycetota bacterium]